MKSPKDNYCFPAHDANLNLIVEKTEVIENDQLISNLMYEMTDYTKWRQLYFAQVDSNDFNTAAIAYCKENPFK